MTELVRVAGPGVSDEVVGEVIGIAVKTGYVEALADDLAAPSSVRRAASKDIDVTDPKGLLVLAREDCGVWPRLVLEATRAHGVDVTTIRDGAERVEKARIDDVARRYLELLFVDATAAPDPPAAVVADESSGELTTASTGTAVQSSVGPAASDASTSALEGELLKEMGRILAGISAQLSEIARAAEELRHLIERLSAHEEQSARARLAIWSQRRGPRQGTEFRGRAEPFPGYLIARLPASDSATRLGARDRVAGLAAPIPRAQDLRADGGVSCLLMGRLRRRGSPTTLGVRRWSQAILTRSQRKAPQTSRPRNVSRRRNVCGFAPARGRERALCGIRGVAGPRLELGTPRFSVVCSTN